MLFQSTLPRGSDFRATTKFRLYCNNFNPRSLAGATLSTLFFGGCNSISIHAPSRERLRYILDLILFLLFQSTLPRGSDFKDWIYTQNGDISIHAPSRERLAVISPSVNASFISIHAPSRERLAVVMVSVRVLPFQSTLPRGSDKMLSNILI